MEHSEYSKRIVKYTITETIHIQLEELRKNTMNRPKTKSKSMQLQKLVTSQQLKAYKEYLNYVTNDQPHVENILTDLHTGLPLIHFIQTVSGKSIARYNKNPTTEIKDRDNLEVFLLFIKNLKIESSILIRIRIEFCNSLRP